MSQLVAVATAGGTDLEAKDADGRTPLRCAADAGHARCGAALVEAGANPNALAR